MMIETTGNLLQARAEALVNTVNTVGVMGKGIALQFKKAYPAMFNEYKRAAKEGELQLGRVQVWSTGQLTGPRYIINFPTKGHWRASSRLRDVESGLDDLVRVVRELGIKSIAIPPLGCGNGGLVWRDVEPKIRAAFDSQPHVEVLLFAPSGAPAAEDIRVATPVPQMTTGRAALVQVLRRYTEQALMAPSLIESQKLIYFLQASGEPLRLNFAANRYGPYADNLRHVLHTVEDHYLSGFGDGSASVQQAEPLTVIPGAAESAACVLAEHPATQQRIDRVLELAEGFESAYGLELLATVHWLATEATASQVTDAELTERVWQWSPRKARMFTEAHVRAALEALRTHGWLVSEPVMLA